ncbi:MAG: hypothetical protein IJR66_03265 [Clostridia bacterium]|nr:hypothetical protein [Clostridia bacterium]
MKNYNLKNRIVVATPILCTFIFLLLGFLWGKWHPAWMVFLLIPLMPYLVGKKKLRFSVPLFITIVYLILGLGWNLWHPAWIIFLLIPVFEIFLSKDGFEQDKKEETDK